MADEFENRIQEYLSEFQDKYDPPEVNRMIVGFSGLDPDRKGLSPSQKEDVISLIAQHGGGGGGGGGSAATDREFDEMLLEIGLL